MGAKMKIKRAASPILASVHEASADLHKLGLVDKATMREFDALCLTLADLSPAEIWFLREP